VADEYVKGAYVNGVEVGVVPCGNDNDKKN
jgi:hypothetical protein